MCPSLIHLHIRCHSIFNHFIFTFHSIVAIHTKNIHALKYKQKKYCKVNKTNFFYIYSCVHLFTFTKFLTILFLYSFSFPQKVNDRQSPAYAIQGNTGGYVYLQQQHYTPPQQVVYQHQICPQMHTAHQMQSTLHKKGSVRNSDVMKRTRTQNA